jgi:hypothetical protein
VTSLGPAYPGGAPHSRGRYTDTSEAAAKSIDPDRLTGLQSRVLEALRAVRSEGRTADELAEELREYRYTIAPRLRELVLLGWVDDSHERRPSPRGSSAIVYVARMTRRPPRQKAPTQRERLEARVKELEETVDALVRQIGGVQRRLL